MLASLDTTQRLIRTSNYTKSDDNVKVRSEIDTCLEKLRSCIDKREFRAKRSDETTPVITLLTQLDQFKDDLNDPSKVDDVNSRKAALIELIDTSKQVFSSIIPITRADARPAIAMHPDRKPRGDSFDNWFKQEGSAEIDLLEIDIRNLNLNDAFAKAMKIGGPDRNHYLERIAMAYALDKKPEQGLMVANCIDIVKEKERVEREINEVQRQNTPRRSLQDSGSSLVTSLVVFDSALGDALNRFMSGIPFTPHNLTQTSRYLDEKIRSLRTLHKVAETLHSVAYHDLPVGVKQFYKPPSSSGAAAQADADPLSMVMATCREIDLVVQGQLGQSPKRSEKHALRIESMSTELDRIIDNLTSEVTGGSPKRIEQIQKGINTILQAIKSLEQAKQLLIESSSHLGSASSSSSGSSSSTSSISSSSSSSISSASSSS